MRRLFQSAAALAAVLVLAVMTAGCDPTEVTGRAVDVFTRQVIDGDNAARRAVLRGLNLYCQAPELVRLTLRDRYDGAVVIHCDRLPDAPPEG